MINSIKFYTKVSTKNVFFLIAIFFILLLGLRTISVLETSLFQYTKFFYFGYICFNIFLIIISSSMIYKKYTVLTFLENRKIKKIITVFISGEIITLLAAIPIILLILFFKNPLFSLSTLLLSITHFLIVWICCNILALSIGITSAIILKNELSIILSLITYSLFIYLSYAHLPNTNINRYFNIFDDNTFIITNDLAGVILNSHYFIDKLFILLISGIILLIGLIVSSRKKLPLIISAFVCTVVLFYLVIIGISKQNQYTPVLHENLEANYSIESYEMDIKIDHLLTNDIKIDLIPKENSNFVSFILNDAFTIDSMSINNVQTTGYSFKDNRIYINYDFIKDQGVSIKINYSGEISIKNDIGYDLFYANKQAINLPGDEFYWYPITSLKAPIQYNVSIDNSTKVYSNLQSDHNVEKNQYNFSGSVKYVSLFAGIYQEYSIDSTNYIFPISYKFENLKSEIDYLLEDTLTEQSNYFSNEEINTLKNHSYTQVIVGNWLGQNVKLDDTTLLIKYKNY